VPDYVTVEGVELMTAGMQWPAQSGDVTVTLEHLADIARAGNDDPLIRAARMKIGHGRWQFTGELGDHDPFWGGEPAFGTVTNFRLGNDGAVLLGDLVEVPAWLADAIPSAWPSRSAEWAWDVQTEGGKRYSAVLTAVALLGAWQPAIADLEDLQRVLVQGPDDLTPASAGKGDGMPQASVSVDTVWQRFNFDWTTSEPVDGVDTYWWWARDIRVDPAEVIADDDAGNLWRVPYSTDGEDAVAFGEPVRVRETYVDVPQPDAAPQPAAASVAPRARAGQRVLAAFSERPSKPKPVNPAASERSSTQEEPTVMDVDTTVLRRRLGLAEDATEEQITEALTAETPRPDAPVPAPEGPTPTPDPQPVPDPVVPGQAPAVTPTAPAAPTTPTPATVSVSQEVWDEQQNRLEALETERQEREVAAATARRDGVVSAAVNDGRIAPAERAHYRELLDVDEAKVTTQLASLTAGRIPVGRERGVPAAASGVDALLEVSRRRMGHATQNGA